MYAVSSVKKVKKCYRVICNKQFIEFLDVLVRVTKLKVDTIESNKTIIIYARLIFTFFM